MKKHYSRYTPEMVERITGIPKEQFLKAADLYTSIRKDGDMKKAGTIIYAVGWTQHTFGTQIIRTAAILQLLLGNVGRAGGGVNALRGHSNIQGATDMAGIFDNLPGYLKVPTPADTSFDYWMKRITPTSSKPAPWDSFNYWSNTPKFAVSFLKALYGDAAKKQNGWAFDYLPKVDRNYSWVQMWDDMYNGVVKGMLAFGMNGVAIGPDSKKNIDALKKADWLVVGEIYPDETSEFWKSPGITQDEMKQIQTTVYRLPCAGFAEKDGSFTNSARWLLWKNTALPTPGDCRLDQAIVAQIFLKVRELYKKDGGKFPDPVYVDGKPWDPTRKQVWWNESTQKWVGNDVPDFKVDSKPKDHMGPFIMNPEGVGRIFGPLGAFADGPLPEHYEPIESPIDNPLHPAQTHNPVVKRFKTPDDKYATPKDGYTVVCTTYRLTELYHYWTKNNPMNVQLVPEPFVEISEEMAQEMGFIGGEKVKVSSIRGEYIAKAMVTKRIKSMMIDGKKVYQIGIPIHQGYRGIKEDEGKDAKTLVNLLTPTVFDPNAYTPEFKGFLVKLEKA